MRRRNEATTLAPLCRPIPQGESMGRQSGARNTQNAAIFHHRRCHQKGVSGLRPDQSVLVARRKAVLQNTSGPVFEQAFSDRRFVERHTVAVQQNIPCPSVRSGIDVRGEKNPDDAMREPAAGTECRGFGESGTR